ncbi:MAG: NADH-quinone oxidoreductase subunit A [Myxococcota bacterium]
MYDFLIILIFVVISIGFVFVALFLGRFVRPSVVDKEKVTTYECGERPFSKAWFNYNPRFYIFALIFIVFDVAIAAALPSFVTFKYFILQNDYQNILISLFAFLTILMVALFYVWIKGDLDWIKK